MNNAERSSVAECWGAHKTDPGVAGSIPAAWPSHSPTFGRGVLHCKVCSKELTGQQRSYCSQTCMAKGYQAKPEAFWSKVDKTDPSGCWPFKGFIKWDGYGWVHRQGKNMAAHRYAWMLTHGEPPAGMHLLHTCDNPPCCNPSHLRLGTHLENMADRVAKGRHRMGRIYPDRVRPKRAA